MEGAQQLSSNGSSVRVLDKASRVLDCFTERQPRLQIADLRRRTGFPATTVARIVKTLVEQNLLERVGDEYRVGRRVLAWTAAASAGSDLVEAARPVIERVRDITGETSGVYVRHGASRIVVATVPSEHAVMYQATVGQVMPLHAGAAGKVFLAFDADAITATLAEGLTSFTPATVTDSEVLLSQLDAVRANGWAFSQEEREHGLNSLAAPVFGAHGGIVAAIAIGGPSFRLTAQTAQVLGPQMAAAAAALSSRLGYSPDPQSTVTNEEMSS